MRSMPAAPSAPLLLATLLSAACASAPQPAPAPAAPAQEAAGGEAGLSAWPAPRPIPERVVPPPAFREAIERGTRAETGVPGPRYWQQWTDYRIESTLLPEAREVTGRVEIVHHNRSPYQLPALVLELTQNFHASGAPRLESAEVTGGLRLARVAAEGQTLGEVETLVRGQAAYQVDFTRMTVLLPRPLEPGGTARLEVEWSFTVPQAGAGARMGYSGDDLVYLAYWYPRVLVLDDVVGWQADRFLGTSEFYHGFGGYDVTVRAPRGWVVWGTGALQNAEEVLRPEVLERLRRATSGDGVVRVSEAGADATRAVGGDMLAWRFRADSVRDVAVAATRGAVWDATRTPVGDRDGDGATDYAAIHAFWRTSAPLWSEVARYQAHAIDFMSRFTGQPYPWPHMTAVEGGGIIGGGMEFPMMTLMGDYNARGDSALYWVTAHELAHMWIPMTISTDERRYAWMDEGSTSWLENQARKEFFPGEASEAGDRQGYLAIAGTGEEGEIMRRSNYHYEGPAYGVATYSKPATLLSTLRALIGEEDFMEGYRALYERWAFKHMYPWDMWNTFEDACGCDLDWFWDSFYRETWVLDQAVGGVRQREDGSATIRIEDRGGAPLPARLTITRADGTTLTREVPVERWLRGAREATVEVGAGAPLTRVEIDAEGAFPDVDRGNNVWRR
ncbi:MAG TPA: M1 family metallopeptidase [Longimicrobiales bacterium]|nr:M1 family metallopeptidase [Longimicrobiales bacterium]